MDRVVAQSESETGSLSSLSHRATGAAMPPHMANAAAGDDVAAGRLLELASRIACDAVNAGLEQSSLPSTAFGGAIEAPPRDRLAERILALAAADAPGSNMITASGAPQAIGIAVPAAPPARLAELILGQQAALQDLDQGSVPVPAMPAPAYPAYGAAVTRREAPHIAMPGAIAGIAAAPANVHSEPRQNVGEPTVLGESWRERIFADGLPGFLAGILFALAIGIALYIMLRRL